MTEQVSAGVCDLCGKKGDDMRYMRMEGDVFVCPTGYVVQGNWICPECLKRIQDRIRRRYKIAGEHTEPAE